MISFREFLEQGTQFSVTGLNAGGRAGQSQFTPEGPSIQAPNPNQKPQDRQIKGPKSIPASSFNVSSKTVTNLQRGFGPLNAGGIVGVSVPPPSPLSPLGLGSPQPMQPPKGINPVKVPKPVSF